MKHPLMKVFVFAIFVFSALVCAVTDATGADKQEFTIFARTGPDSSEWLRIVAERFTADTGITVNFIEQGQNGYFTNLTNQLVAGADDFDLAVTNSTYVGPWAYAGYIEPLDAHMSKFAPDYNADDLAFSYAIDGKTYAIPYSISAHFLYYRTDLISENDIPKTWDDLLTMAKKFTKSHNPDSPTPYGLAWTAKAGPEQPKTFYNYLWSLGGEIEVDGKATVASEAGLKAGSYWAQIVADKLAPPEIANYSYSEVLEALQTGVVAMACPYWSAGYADITNKESAYKSLIKCALLPAGVKNVCFTHSYTMVLNAKGRNKDLAMKYYEYLTDAANQLAYAKINGMAARYSALKDPSLDRGFFDVALKSLEVARYEPLVPYYLEQHDIMNIALSGIMTGTVDYREALKTAQEELQALYDAQR